MKTSNRVRRDTSLLALTCSLAGTAFALGAGAAHAEDAARSEIEEVAVTGIRGSLQDAADRKRDSDTFIDAIVAEDIGKLPDNNVAESLQRVSGVQIRRTAGEGSSVAIRGLRQNRIEINGRSYVGPYGRGVDDTSAGGGNQDVLRYLPSELISSLEVTKLMSADQIEGSLGGTVNVKTRKPLDNAGFNASAGLDLSRQDLNGDAAEKFSFLVSNSFADDTIGVQLSGVVGGRNAREDKFWNFGGWVPMSGVDNNGDGIDAFRMSDLRYQSSVDERDDDALNLVVQWQPSDKLNTYAEVLHTNSDTENYRDWVAANTSGNLADYNGTAEFSGSDSLLSGTYNTAIQGNVTRAQFDSTTTQFAFGGELMATERLMLSSELSHSKAELVEGQQFLRAQTDDSYEVSFDFGAGEFASLMLPGNVDFTDPSLYSYTVGFDRLFYFENEETAFRLDADYELGMGIFESIEAGVRWADMAAEKDFHEQVFRPGINAADPSVAGLWQSVNRGNILGGSSGINFPGEYLVPDASGGPGYCANFVPDCAGPTPSPTNYYKVEDTITAAYLKANYFTEVNGYAVSGHFGVRVASTDTTVNNTATLATDTGSELVAQSIEESYTDVLPSAVMKVDLSENLLLRLGYADVIARPDTIDLAVALDVDPKEGAASAGNPGLEPFRASQFDASLEWYFDNEAALTTGIFYKDVESFIVTETNQEVLPGFGDTPYLVTRQRNGEGGSVNGVEISYQQPFTFLPQPFDGFGALVNYSWIDSSTGLENARTGEELPLIGLSENNFNVIAYYENDLLSARLAYNWRDEFVDKIGAGGAAVFTEDFSSLDLSLRYNITDSVALDFEAINLTEEPEQKYVGTADARWIHAEIGRRLTLGLSATF
ncbi:TonB-dependent receptor [Microbulbifer sp. ALW1]|uniref:TonB-dependent receptor n=1 Tax=Microbulbifer sp. (strain ALW1) TaxID=1516059 RepID=UPI00135A9C10|nr:TonB-dependent receptor [Microbulbifer sp. ALW1]